MGHSLCLFLWVRHYSYLQARILKLGDTQLGQYQTLHFIPSGICYVELQVWFVKPVLFMFCHHVVYN